jgi:hypothetical protein
MGKGMGRSHILRIGLTGGIVLLFVGRIINKKYSIYNREKSNEIIQI